jgi:hypothetical protein
MAKAAAKKDDDNVVPLRKNTPSEDGVIALNLGKLMRAKAEFESAGGTYRNVLKHVEAKGVNLAAAKEAIALKKSGKAEEAIAYMTAVFHYCQILGVPFTKAQLDLFKVEAPRMPAIDKAKEHGLNAGRLGLGTSENPYSIDSEQGQAWMEAFHRGTEERNLILSMEADDEVIKGSDDDDAGHGDEPSDDGD